MSQVGGRPPSGARQELLRAAQELFYRRGIHSVSVDQIITEAKVTRGTFYRHFPSKEDLVLAYLHRVHESYRRQVGNAIAAHSDPAEALLAIAQSTAEEIQASGFRGCAFLNAAAEFSDKDDPVRREVMTHRQWYLDMLTALMVQVDPAEPLLGADQFVVLRDGAMAAGWLSDPATVAQTLLSMTAHLVSARVDRPASTAGC